MKKVLPFEVIGIESLFTCYLFDLSAIFKSLESYPVYDDKTASVNTVKTEQLPTEKLFGLVMIFGRHENLTFTKLEQRLVKIHRGFDFRRFPNRSSFIFHAKILRQPICDESKSCVSRMYIFCAKYFSSHLELNCWAKLISYSDILSDSMCEEYPFYHFNF